jgi:UrcA family protein
MKRIAIAIIVQLALSASAHAETEQHQVLVRAADLRLSRPADANRLLNRLERASLEVCGSGEGSSWLMIAATKRSECYLNALGSAVSAAHAPTLNLAFAKAYPGQSQSQLASTGP